MEKTSDRRLEVAAVAGVAVDAVAVTISNA